MASLRDTQTIFNLLDAQHLKNIILKNTSSEQYCWSCLENSTSLRGYYLINCLSKITVLNLNSNKAKSKRELIFFFFGINTIKFQHMCSMMIAFYHQAKTLISF